MAPCNYVHACTTVNMFVGMCVPCMHACMIILHACAFMLVAKQAKQKYDVKHKIDAEKKDIKQSSPYL